MKLGSEIKDRSLIISISIPKKLFEEIDRLFPNENRSKAICRLIRFGLMSTNESKKLEKYDIKRVE